MGKKALKLIQDRTSRGNASVQATASASEEALRYIRRHPSARDCLQSGLLNLSATARIIINQSAAKPALARAAVVMALRRLKPRVAGVSNQAALLKLVTSARLATESGIAVIIFTRAKLVATEARRLRSFQQKYLTQSAHGIIFDIAELPDASVLFCSASLAAEVRHEFFSSIIISHLGMARVVLEFGPKIESTAGVVAYIYALLAERGINIVEEISCWNKIILFVRENDLSPTIEALQSPRLA